MSSPGSDRDPARAGRKAWLTLVVALLPVAVYIVWGLVQNHLTLIDDAVTILSAGRPFREPFRAMMAPDSERFVPLYFEYYWMLFKLLPAAAWSLTLGNGICLAACSAFTFSFVRARAGEIAGLAAAWLLVLNSAAADNAFTLSKPEIQQLTCWLAALWLIERALSGNHCRWRLLDLLFMLIASTGAVFIKESGVFLAMPCGLLALYCLVAGERTPADRRWSAALSLAGVFPPLIAVGIILSHRFGGANSYAQRHFMSATPPPLTMLPSLDWQVGALLAAGLVAAAFIVVRRWRSADAWLAAMLASQLLASLMLYSRKLDLKIYYLLPAAAFAAILTAWACALPGKPGRYRWRAPVLSAALIWGAAHAFVVAQALAGWGWLHQQVIQAVLRERPARVAFFVPVNSENVYEARLHWTSLHDLPVIVGVLGGNAKTLPSVVKILNPRELQTGDLIIEEFGTPGNRAFPLRDFFIENPVTPPPEKRHSLPRIPVETAWTMTARFPAFRQSPGIGRPTHSISWRISRVTAPANYEFSGLGTDGWMSESAELFVNLRRVSNFDLRFNAYRVENKGAERLLIKSGEQEIANCPADPGGVAKCSLHLAALPLHPDPEGWVTLRLSSDQTRSPAEDGGADARRLSFNFSPTWRD